MKFDIEYKDKDVVDFLPTCFTGQFSKKEFTAKIDFFRAELTKLKYNIKIFHEYRKNFLTTQKMKEEYNCFSCILLLDMSMYISVKFSTFFDKNNGINFKKFLNKYCQNKVVLSGKQVLLEESLQKYTDAESIYKRYIKSSRDKIYAHHDKEVLDEKELADIFDVIDSEKLMDCCNYLIESLTILFNIYGGKNLCFELKNGDDYIKVIELLTK